MLRRPLMILLIAVIVFAGCTKKEEVEGNEAANKPASTSNNTLKIGAILGLTGPFEKAGIGIRNSLNLYLEQHNNMLGNMKVEVKYEDDEGNPQTALRKYRQLVTGDKVDFLIGPDSSGVLNVLVDEVAKDKKLLIIPNAALNSASWEKKNDYIYRISYSNWQSGTAAASYVAKNIGKKAVAIGSDYPAAHEAIDAFKKEFEKSGGQVIKELYPKLNTSDYATYIMDISQSKPEVVFMFLINLDGIRFLKQFNDFGLKGKIQVTGTEFSGEPDFISAAGGAAEGIIVPLNYSYLFDNAVNKKFVEDFKKKFNRLPNLFEVFGYDTGLAISRAIEKAGNGKTEDLIKALKGITWESPRGQITIDPKTNNPIQNYFISRMVKKDNTIVPQFLQTVEKLAMPEKDPGK